MQRPLKARPQVSGEEDERRAADDGGNKAAGDQPPKKRRRGRKRGPHRPIHRSQSEFGEPSPKQITKFMEYFLHHDVDETTLEDPQIASAEEPDLKKSEKGDSEAAK